MTTTAISDISDLARILEEHPEWFVPEMREFVRVTQEQTAASKPKSATCKVIC